LWIIPFYCLLGNPGIDTEISYQYHGFVNKTNISYLAAGIEHEKFSGPDNVITNLAYDSRSVKKGSLFFTMPGIHTDGHNFILTAIDKGAAGIVHSLPIDTPVQGISYIQVKDPRTALSPISAIFYDHPSKKMHTIGVTGTDGKSTTVYFIYQLLTLLGEKAGFLSTVNYLSSGNTIRKNPFRQSTPEASEIHGILRDMADNGKEYAVIEATSHGLSAKNNRLGDVSFDTAVFTNITHEHLEFHGSFEDYRKDKVRLFHMLDREDDSKGKRFGVINKDDPNFGYFQQGTHKPVYSYSTAEDKEADLYGEIESSDIYGTSFGLYYKGHNNSAYLPLPGLFHVEDLLAAALTVCALFDCPISRLIPYFGDLKPVPGRFQPVRMGQPFSVFIDYAHTPGSFKKLLPKVKSWTPGRLIVVFGSAGERDFEKRSLQGRIADEIADTIILTDEDPRGETPEDILRDIQRGCSRKKEGLDLFCITDRKEAINKAFSLARKDDTVLLLGKGHESSIIYSSGPIDWNEKETAEGLLKDRRFYQINDGNPL